VGNFQPFILSILAPFFTDGSEFNGEPVYLFQLYNSKKGSIAIRRYNDKLIVNINDQLFYASEPLIEVLERFKSAKTIGSVLIE